MKGYSEEKILGALDVLLIEQSEDGNRKHLGASLLGTDCTRRLFLTFRHARKPPWKYLNLKPKTDDEKEKVRKAGALLRLFERGHLEEHRFVKYLRMLGCEVAPFADPIKEIQHRISGAKGHGGGSLDCIIEKAPKKLFPPGRGLGEFKTHNAKSFAKLVKEKVQSAKYEHYVQMQLYMGKMELAWALYMAVNKDTDELHLELVEFDQRTFDKYYQRGDDVVFSADAPPRINPNPSFFGCKFCDFHPLCHGFEVPEVNCRTCCHSTPVEDGKWTCGIASQRAGKPVVIPDNVMAEGCPEHVFLPSILNAEYIGPVEGRNIELKLANGDIIRTGPDYIKSTDLCSLAGIK